GGTSAKTSGPRIPQTASSGSRLVWAGTHPRPSSARRMNMSKFAVVEASIADLRTAPEDGTTTSVGLVEAYQDRISAFDGPESETRLNSVVVENPQALA